MTHELEATRAALEEEREERKIERYSMHFSASQPAAVDNMAELSDLSYERKLRMEILESLKKVRAQNAILATSIGEQTENCASLTSIVEHEREERRQLEHRIEKLQQANFTLLEHNKLLVGRDSALQQDISTLLTKSQADDWMRGVLEAELRQARQSDGTASPTTLEGPKPTALTPKPDSRRPTLGITLENHGPLRAQLFAARDELHITKLRLGKSEATCADLAERLTTLQHKMTSCVDSSARALDVERELRREGAEREAALVEETHSLTSALNAARTELDSLKSLTGRRSTDALRDADSSSMRSSRPEAKVKFEQFADMMNSRRISIGPEVIFMFLHCCQNVHLVTAAKEWVCPFPTTSPAAQSAAFTFNFPFFIDRFTRDTRLVVNAHFYASFIYLSPHGQQHVS